MPQFFIHRPVFAWVIALFIVLAGVIAIPKLPISRYPSVAPVSVTLYATYPGATPQTLNDAVVSLIERELSGVKNLLLRVIGGCLGQRADHRHLQAGHRPGAGPDGHAKPHQGGRAPFAASGAAKWPAGGIRLFGFSDDGRHDLAGWSLR